MCPASEAGIAVLCFSKKTGLSNQINTGEISRGTQPINCTIHFFTSFFLANGLKRMQGIVIAGLVKVNLIHEVGTWTTDNVEKGIQDLLVCVEMLLIAVAHTTAFSSEPYEDGATRRDSSSLLEAHFAHHSAVRDFNEVSTCALRLSCIRVEERGDPPPLPIVDKYAQEWGRGRSFH